MLLDFNKVVNDISTKVENITKTRTEETVPPKRDSDRLRGKQKAATNKTLGHETVKKK